MSVVRHFPFSHRFWGFFGFSQATTGTLAGTVIDTGGNVVANATVRLKNEGTGLETTTVSNGEGAYSFAALLPGSYTVTTEAQGFKRSVKTGVQVKVGITNPLEIGLEAGVFLRP